MFVVRNAQGILECRLSLRCLDETMEDEWKACKDFEYYCVETLQEPTGPCYQLFD